MTVAPELPGALELIARLAAHGVAASLGHSQATARRRRGPATSRAPRSTTHLFNAMTGVDHRRRVSPWRRCSTTRCTSS